MLDQLEYAQYKAQCIKNITKNIVRSNAPDIKILDFGCNDGTMTNYLQELFFEASVVGIDQSAEAIERAKARYPDIDFHVADDFLLPFGSQTFDLIVAADVAHHIPHAQHRQWIAELMRALKPRGTLIVLELNPWNLFTCREFNNNPLEKDAKMLSPLYAYNLLQKHGTVTFYNLMVFNFGLQWLNALLGVLRFSLPIGRVYAIMCTSRQNQTPIKT